MTVSMTYPQSLRREATIGGAVRKLTQKQHGLLTVLLLRRGGAVPMHDLIEATWPHPDFEPQWAEECIDMTIWRLRQLGVEIITLGSGRWMIDKPGREVLCATPLNFGLGRLKKAA